MIAFAFFRLAKLDDNKFSGEPFVVGEVFSAVIHKSLEGGPDGVGLEMKKLGDNVCCGG